MKILRTVLALLPLLAPLPAAAQTRGAPQPAWNDARALELIHRAQARRAETSADTGLVNFQADARLYVYFYLDRPNTGERNLVKTDQLALDVLWQAPNRVKQRIVGWRDEKSLPTDINYHLDHLTVVLENFGDEIRIGDGDEVRGVPHPASVGSEGVYEYHLADSLTLQLPGTTEPLRVYELQVRPKDANRPAFIGSVFVDRRAGDIVRMDFTFTRTSYIDPYLDYINISLDNGLWRGRFWLPNQQRVEIRRRIPIIDVPVGSTIRATMRVSNYRFNQDLPAGTFAGPRVVAVPRAQRQAFPFEQELHAEVREEGIGPSVELGAIRREAEALVRQQALQRASQARLRVTSVSDVFRYNRAEGAVLSAGARLTSLASPVRVTAQGGWAFGAEHPILGLGATAPRSALQPTASLYLNRPRDIGPGPVSSGLNNSIAALFAGSDFLDLYYATGAEVGAERTVTPHWSLRAGARAEKQRSAGAGSGFSLLGDFRPVRPIDETDLLLGATLAARRQSVSEAARWWTADLVADAGSLRPRGEGTTRMGFVKPHARVEVGRRWNARDSELRLVGLGGFAVGDLPAQEAFLVGGRGTIPGYPFRSMPTERFGTLNATLSAELSPPWLRGRLIGAVGWADRGVKPSLGIGAGIFHDIVQVDVAHGLAADGRWELIVEANPSLWDFL
jgi:hypothetical protein